MQGLFDHHSCCCYQRYCFAWLDEDLCDIIPWVTPVTIFVMRGSSLLLSSTPSLLTNISLFLPFPQLHALRRAFCCKEMSSGAVLWSDLYPDCPFVGTMLNGTILLCLHVSMHLCLTCLLFSLGSLLPIWWVHSLLFGINSLIGIWQLLLPLPSITCFGPLGMSLWDGFPVW